MSLELENFYELLWEEKELQQFFFRHREEVLTKQKINLGDLKFAFYHDRLVLSNNLKIQARDRKLARRIKGKGKALEKSLQNLDTTIPKTIESFLTQKHGRLLNLAVSVFVPNKVTRIRLWKEISDGIVSEKRFLKLLRKYNVLGKESEAQDVNDLLSTGFDALRKSIPEFVSPEMLSRIFSGVDNMVDLYSNWSKGELQKAQTHYSNVLYGKENYAKRLDLFEDLYESGVLLGGKSKAHYECIQCPSGTFYGSLTLNISPKKLDIACPNCGKEMLYMVPYHIHEDIFEDIVDDDGLLLWALEYLLEERKVVVQTNYHPKHDEIKDLESDLVLFDPQGRPFAIVEVKMFKSDRTFETQVANFKKNLNKFLKAREKYLRIDEGFQNVDFFFVTNTFDDAVKSKVLEDLKGELSGIKVSLYSPQEFKILVDNL